MIFLTDMQRAYLSNRRAISSDLEGNEIFVGLTLKESMRFNFLSQSLLEQEQRTQEDVDEYLLLVLKHEHSRLQLLGLAIEAQQKRIMHH